MSSHNLTNLFSITRNLGCFQFFVFVREANAVLAGIFVGFSPISGSLKTSWGVRPLGSLSYSPAPSPRAGGRRSGSRALSYWWWGEYRETGASE